MKKYCLSIMIFFLSLTMVFGGSNTFAVEKTGFVDVRDVLMKSEAGKRASEEFKKLYDKDRAQIEAKEAELKKLKDELERQRTILTESAMRAREAAYQKEFRYYQMMVKDANEELQARDQEFSKEFIPKVLKVVQAIGEREKYSLIIDISTIPIAYYSKEKDITKRVIDEFNKQYK